MGHVPFKMLRPLTPPQAKERLGPFRLLRLMNCTDQEENYSLGINMVMGLGVPWVSHLNLIVRKDQGEPLPSPFQGSSPGHSHLSKGPEPSSHHPRWPPRVPSSTAQMCPRGWNRCHGRKVTFTQRELPTRAKPSPTSTPLIQDSRGSGSLRTWPCIQIATSVNTKPMALSISGKSAQVGLPSEPDTPGNYSQ